IFFFFSSRRRHTRFSRDWSSDVCSSDLTDGDSEVILAAWQRWGAACLPRLHGMFAFAIYDLEQRTLFLARDRLGVKPLFLAALKIGRASCRERVWSSEGEGSLTNERTRD